MAVLPFFGFVRHWWFLQCCIRICFQDYVHFRARLQRGLFAFIIRQFVIDTNFPVQMVGIMNVDFCLFWLAGMRDLITFATVPRSFLRFLVIKLTPLSVCLAALL